MVVLPDITGVSGINISSETGYGFSDISQFSSALPNDGVIIP
jgi:hypothetical protein